jgi:site-specific recombinase XerD
MAFVRCWAEGLDLVAAWDRYLYVDGAGDARRARGELQRLLDQLRGVALAHGRKDVAVLLRRDPEAIPERGTAQPTLEAFRAQQPADFYTEAELVELYHSEHGALPSRSPARRKQRLRERLLAAVQWLEGLGARAPAPGDPVSAWLDEKRAARLAVVGIQTLEELLYWIRNKGFHWHRGIPRLGPEGAARVVRWLQEHAASLGALPSAALFPLSRVDTAALTPPPRMGVVPLERLVLPADRNGSRGLNRAALERCKLAAANDLQALQAWLRLRVEGSHTWRAYRKEAERFLLWAVLHRRKALSSLDGDDCVAYRDFLAKPGLEWTGPRHAQRWSEAWRPFEGPLGARSQQAAMTIVRSLCEWLVRRQYLDSNPWDDVPQRPDAPSMPRLRALSQHQWDLVQSWLDDCDARAPSPAPALESALSRSLALSRLRFILAFAYLTGLRLSELVASRVEWLRHEQLDDGEWAWSLMVLGKRNKWREVPLPDAALTALQGYFADRGLDQDLLSNPPATPLIAHLNRNAPLSAARLYEVLVHGFERCAAEWATRDRRAAERIREASTHWLRHTHGSHAVARGVPPDVLQANLGHESLATTSIYVQAEKGRRHRAVQAAFASGTRRKAA